MGNEGFYLGVKQDLLSCFKGKQRLSFKQFSDALKSFRFEYKYDFEDLSSRLTEIKRILYTIVSIINKPRTATSSDPVIVRSEQARYVSNDSFLKTARDSSLWRRKNGVLEPERVHTEENVDTLNTYENRFITTLIGILSDELSEIGEEMALTSASFMSKYKVEGIFYSPLSFYGLYQGKHCPYKEELALPKEDGSEMEKDLHEANKLIRRIKGSFFYARLKNEPPLRNVEATNILIHDPLYSHCFKYYKKKLANAEEDHRKEDAIYRDYFLCLFFRHLGEKKLLLAEKGLKPFSYQEGGIAFEPFSLKDDFFEYAINEESDGSIHLAITCLIGELMDEERTTEYLLKVRRKLTKEDWKALTKEYAERNVNLIIVSLFNSDHIYSNVLNISYFSSDKDALMEELFTSFAMLFNIPGSEAQNRCLCCSSKEIARDNHLVSCHKCGSEYLSFAHLGEQYALIRKPWKRKR